MTEKAVNKGKSRLFFLPVASTAVEQANLCPLRLRASKRVPFLIMEQPKMTRLRSQSKVYRHLPAVLDYETISLDTHKPGG